jgi:hypothetical protein
MASVQHTEQHQQRIDLGQRFFLLGIFAVMVIELVGIIVNIGSSFAWSALVLNVFASVFVLYLGNWLYGGDRTALSVARGWIAVMAVVSGFGLACAWAGPPTAELGRYVGITAVWLGLLKFIIYGTCALALFSSGYVLDYLAAQRGETAAAPVTAEPQAAAAPAELAADHVTALEGLAGAMKIVCFVLLAVGLFEAGASLSRLGSEQHVPAILGIVEGLAVATLGCLLMAPLKAVQALAGAAQRHMGYVMQFLARFHALFLAYIVTFGVLAAVAVCRVVLAAQ